MTIWFHGVVDDSLNVQGFLSCLNASIQFMRIIIISWIVLTGILCHRWTLMHPWIENERSTSITERDTPHTGRSCLGRSASDGCRRSGGTESLGWCSYWCNHPADRSQCLAPTGGGSGWRGTTYPDWSVPCIDELPSAVSPQVLALLALFFHASQDLEKRVEASHHHPTAVPTYVTNVTAACKSSSSVFSYSHHPLDSCGPHTLQTPREGCRSLLLGESSGALLPEQHLGLLCITFQLWWYERRSNSIHLSM